MTEALIADWIHPPEAMVETSMYFQLHDANIVSFESDLVRRELRVGIIPSHAETGASLAPVTLAFTGVGAMRATASRSGVSLVIPPGTPWDTQMRMHAEHRKRLVARSVEWERCEAALAGGGFEILQASLLSGPGSMSVRWDVATAQMEFFRVEVRCESAAVLKSTGESISLDVYAMGPVEE